MECDTSSVTLVDANSDANISANEISFGSTPCKVDLNEETFNSLDREQLWAKWRMQNEYIEYLEGKVSSAPQSPKPEAATMDPKEFEERLKQQQNEAFRRENILIMRLNSKKRKVADLANRIQAMREDFIPSESRLNSTLLDPALNLMFERMKSEVSSSKERVEQMQNELAAWKFTTDSHTGKQLMAKCQALYKENEELGKTVESGRIGKLEGELALQKSFVEEMKKSQMETDEFLFEIDEEVEGLQATILHLRNQLKEAKSESAPVVPNHPLEIPEQPKEPITSELKS